MKINSIGTCGSNDNLHDGNRFRRRTVEEHVQIAGFDCIIENGQYYTEINGERCLVINLDEYMPEAMSSMVGSKESSSVLSVNETKTQIYSDTVNLTRDGDYSSPELDCSPSNGFILRILDAFFIKKVKLRFHGYSENALQWIPLNDVTLSFSALDTERKVAVLGESAKYYSQCRLEIFKEGTTFDGAFSYGLYEF